MNHLKKFIIAVLTEFFDARDVKQEPVSTIDVMSLPSVSGGMTVPEQKLLEDLSQSKEFKSILGKIEYGLALGSMNCRDTHDIAEIRGGQKILKALSGELLSNYPKRVFNPLTGE